MQHFTLSWTQAALCSLRRSPNTFVSTLLAQTPQLHNRPKHTFARTATLTTTPVFLPIRVFSKVPRERLCTNFALHGREARVHTGPCQSYLPSGQGHRRSHDGRAGRVGQGASEADPIPPTVQQLKHPAAPSHPNPGLKQVDRYESGLLWTKLAEFDKPWPNSAKFGPKSAQFTPPPRSFDDAFVLGRFRLSLGRIRPTLLDI